MLCKMKRQLRYLCLNQAPRTDFLPKHIISTSGNTQSCLPMRLQCKIILKRIPGGGSFKEIYGKLCRDDHWSSASKCINILKAGVQCTPLQKNIQKHMGWQILEAISKSEPTPSCAVFATVFVIPDQYRGVFSRLNAMGVVFVSFLKALKNNVWSLYPHISPISHAEISVS